MCSKLSDSELESHASSFHEVQFLISSDEETESETKEAVSTKISVSGLTEREMAEMLSKYASKDRVTFEIQSGPDKGTLSPISIFRRKF